MAIRIICMRVSLACVASFFSILYICVPLPSFCQANGLHAPLGLSSLVLGYDGRFGNVYIVGSFLQCLLRREHFPFKIMFVTSRSFRHSRAVFEWSLTALGVRIQW